MSIDPLYARYTLIAACMMHVEGAFSTRALAFLDKNPGNIMQQNPDGTHTERKYPTIQAGFNALVADIAANAGRPLSAFIAKYAPPNENNTSLYLQEVSTLSGIGTAEPI